MQILGIRRMWAAALALGILGWTAGDAAAAPLTYNTIGTLQNPANVSRGLVYYDGITGGAVNPSNGSAAVSNAIDLGHFVVDPSIVNTNATYLNHPFEFVISSGAHASQKVSGVLNGVVGPNVGNPQLFASVTSVESYGRDSLPFVLGIPMNSQLRLALPSSASAAAATTALMGVATPIPSTQVLPTGNPGAAPIPEPGTIAIFGVAASALGLWRRRRPAAA